MDNTSYQRRALSAEPLSRRNIQIEMQISYFNTIMESASFIHQCEGTLPASRQVVPMLWLSELDFW